MLIRVVIAALGLLEALAPRRVANVFLSIACTNPEDVELRPWVIHCIRLEGLALIGYVLWQSRDDLQSVVQPGSLEEYDVDYEEWEDEPWEDAPSGEPAPAEESATAESLPTITPETRRFDLAAVLYHSEDPLTVSEIVDLSDGTDWAVGRSPASATLYRMFNDGVVDREQRAADNSFEYWLTPAGTEALEALEAPIEPDPF